MVRHQKTLHSGVEVNLSWGGKPSDINRLVDKILKERGVKREHPPIDEEWDAMGACVFCGDRSFLIWLENKPTFKNMGTIAHEVFHLWTYWVQSMDRTLDVNETNPGSMEVDAYFFSDVCDWIYSCAKRIS